jgi:hypothetical protein
MVGLESVVNGIENEDRTIRDEAKALHNDLWDSKVGVATEGEPMRVMAAHDVYVNTKPPTETAPSPPSDDPPSPTEPTQQPVVSKPASKLAKAALAAALLGTFAGGGVVVPWAIDQLFPPAVEAPAAVDTDTTRSIEVEVWRPEGD